MLHGWGIGRRGAAGLGRRKGDVGSYLTHAANTFAIWFNRGPIVGASIRFVVRSDGRVSDVSADSLPADSAARVNMELRLRNIPFALDPLPPSYPAEAVALQASFVARCHSPRTSLFWGQPTTITPLADGSIEVANIHPSWQTIWNTRELPPSRDVVSAEALEFFLDTTATLLPSSDGKFPPALDRWSGSLAEVPVLGYRGERGLILGLSTQGQLHGNISCGRGGEWINVRREDIPEFWRIGREALAMRSSAETGVDRSSGRPYEESEVACPVMPAVGNAAVPYPAAITGDARTSHEVLVSFTVDTTGSVEGGSIALFPGTDARFARAVRAVVPHWRFRAALRGGKRVRQRTHLAIVVRPPEADAAVLASRPLVAPDSTNRTIFFRKRP